MNIFSNPKWVSKTPVVTALLFEYANVGQVLRMYNEKTAAGQSIWSWLAVNAGLMLFINFYRICCPNEKFAFWATTLSAALNWLVVFTIIYYRYFYK